MKLLILLGLVANSVAFAEIQTQKSCRDAVVEGKAMVGEYVSPESFSSRTFDSYNLTAEEFNSLDSDEQTEIYNQIKPIEIVVEDTVATLNRYIEYYTDSPYAFYYIDRVQRFREAKDALLNCK